MGCLSSKQTPQSAKGAVVSPPRVPPAGVKAAKPIAQAVNVRQDKVVTAPTEAIRKHALHTC